MSGPCKFVVWVDSKISRDFLVRIISLLIVIRGGRAGRSYKYACADLFEFILIHHRLNQVWSKRDFDKMVEGSF